MQSKELKVLEIPKWGRYLRGKWLENFAGHLTNRRTKGNIYGFIFMAPL